jgi:hypothetical protein
MRKVYSSCGISAVLALMISPIGSIPICEVSCEHDSITEVAGDGEILIMLSELDFADFMPRSREFYIGDMQAKLQERAVDRRVRRSRSPSFLPVSSTMTGTIACGYVEGGVRVGMPLGPQARCHRRSPQ